MVVHTINIMDINFPKIMKVLKEKITISPHEGGLIIKTRPYRKLTVPEFNYLCRLPMFTSMRDIVPVEYWHLEFDVCRSGDDLLIKTAQPELAHEFIENMLDPEFIRQLIARLMHYF
ncbi:MAG: hypothetical protein ACFFCS_06540 [Candidatus Hodarchaeota archaeon]